MGATDSFDGPRLSRRGRRGGRLAALALALLTAAGSTVVVAEQTARAPQAAAATIDPGPPPVACTESWYRTTPWPRIENFRNTADPTGDCYLDRAWKSGWMFRLRGGPRSMGDGETIDITTERAAVPPDAWEPPQDPPAEWLRASYRLRFNYSPEFPYDYNPFLRSIDGRAANPTMGDDSVFAIPPTWDTSGCEGPEGTGYRWFASTCNIKLIKGPYYATPAGQPVPWMVFTGALFGNPDSAGFDIPMMTNCSGSGCPGPPNYWGQRNYMEMPVYIKPSPYAVFAKNVVEGRTFRFDATGSLYNGTIDTYVWDFGDGTTGTGAIVEHTYATEGTYTAKLTVNADGQQGATAAQLVAERTVALNLSISVNDTTPDPDQPVTASYKVTNIGDTTVTGVTVDHHFEPGAGWTGLSPATANLAVGASVTMTQLVFPDEIPFTIRATASGTAGGEAVTSRPKALNVGEPNAIDVSVDVNPTEVDLDEDGDGDLEPQPVTATVTISNTGSGTLEDVDVTPQLQTGDNPAPVVVDGTMPDMDIASLSGGQSRQFTVDLTAQEAGSSTFYVDATVLGGSQAGMGDSDSRDIEVTGQAPVSFTWKMQERYTKPTDAATDLSRGDPKTWTIFLDFKVNGTCPTNGQRTWKLNGVVVVPPLVDPAKPCYRKLDRPNLEPFSLELQAKSVTGQVIGKVTQELEPRDLVIVSVGDSMSSGEGNPERTGSATWQHEPCHRSSESGMAKAARRLENDGDPSTTEDDHSSVTFVHLACSGASMDRGLIGAFNGVTGGGQEMPQLLRFRGIIGNRDVDAMLMTIGINDIRFGDVLKHCLTSFDCESATFEGEPLELFLEREIAALSDNYSTIADYLTQLGVPAGKVHLIEYPHPASASAFSDEICSYQSISVPEMTFLYSELLQALNQKGAASAGQLGWDRIGGIESGFRGHGLCAGFESWMVGIFDSFAKQGNPAGGFHPNYSGHDFIAQQVLDAIPADQGGTGKRVTYTMPTIQTPVKRGVAKLKLTSKGPIIKGTIVDIGGGNAAHETRKVTAVTAGSSRTVEDAAALAAVADGTLDPVEEGGVGSDTAAVLEDGAGVTAAAATTVYTITLDKPLLYDHGASEPVLALNSLPAPLREDRLLVSDGPNRFDGARPLYREQLSSPKAIWYDPPPGVTPKSVKFFVDGKLFATDSAAPYDMVVGQALTVTGFDPSVLTNGEHLVKAVAVNAAGAEVSSEQVPITVANATPRTVRLAKLANRSASVPLEGATIAAGPAYVFLGPTATTAIKGLGPVEFVVDGVLVDSDPAAPYDVGDGGGPATGVKLPAAARKLGNHVLVVRLKLPSGQLHEITRASYRVTAVA